MKPPRALAIALSLAAAFCAPFFFARDASAYTWMIRHGYTGCMPCHADPSGGGALTPYGRAQGELLMQDRYGATDEEASALAGTAWGQIQTNDNVRLGGDFREAFFTMKPDQGPSLTQWITMQADVFADVKIGHFRVEGSLGFIPQGDLLASLTSNSQDNLISRDHWLGYELDDDGSMLVRAGRMNLPYGIRLIEHTLFARQLTRTDIDDQQQYGLALSVTREQYRGELMAIVGNFQVHPDDFRERGYSGYFEYEPEKTLAVGASSMFKRATRDIDFGVTDYRYCNGLFLRYAPVQQLVVLAEADSVYQSLTWNGHRGGYAAFAQADVEPTQGVHLMLTGETMNGGSAGEQSSYGAWLSMGWFFWSHMDLRVDNVYQVLGSAGGTTNALSLLVQLHAYL